MKREKTKFKIDGHPVTRLHIDEAPAPTSKPKSGSFRDMTDEEILRRRAADPNWPDEEVDWSTAEIVIPVAND